MKTQITLSQAIEGYLLDARARRLSPRTIADYETFFRKFQAHIGDPPLDSITPDDIRSFLVHLGSCPVSPAGVARRPARRLSKKTIRNTYVGLSSLWTWAIKEELVTHHVVRVIRPPRPEKPAIEPFSKADVEAMLKACERTESYTRPGKQECTHTRPTAARDRAIILLLLDTGARASEVCADSKRGTPGLLIQNVDHRNLDIKVMGKGDKERILRISARTSKAIWRYLLERKDAAPTDSLFLSMRGTPLTTDGLLQLIKRLGERADVPGAHPHRFRHTFAVNFLRNGANTLELQHLLGHTTLEMVKRYVKIAQVDLENAHRRASPVANWQL
jgi:integrase/recombinase XerD